MKKILFVVFSMTIMSCVLVGCNAISKQDNNGNELPVLKAISNNASDIVYDTKTTIVYWDTYGSLTPYLSKDGRYCRYEKGEIVPIERRE